MTSTYDLMGTGEYMRRHVDNALRYMNITPQRNAYIEHTDMFSNRSSNVSYMLLYVDVDPMATHAQLQRGANQPVMSRRDPRQYAIFDEWGNRV